MCEVYNSKGELLLNLPSYIAVANYVRRRKLTPVDYYVVYVLPALEA